MKAHLSWPGIPASGESGLRSRWMRTMFASMGERPGLRFEPLGMMKGDIPAGARRALELVPREQGDVRPSHQQCTNLIAHVSRALGVHRDTLHVVRMQPFSVNDGIAGEEHRPPR
jgi:hypothetical protein